MPRSLRPDQLAASLKKSPAPAYYLHGGEDLLKSKALTTIVDALLDPAVRDFNLDNHSAKQLDPADLSGVASSVPMMSERRVVVVRDIENWKRKTKAKLAAAAYLAAPSPETVVVLVQGDDKDPDKALVKNTVAISCSAPVGDALEEWLDGRLEEAGVRLNTDARNHLISATGGDLGLLSAEAAKLSGLGGDEPIDLDTVGDLVGVKHGETVDDWRDAVLRDDLEEAVRILPRVLDQSGVSAVRMVMVLGGALVTLQWARGYAERERRKGSALVQPVKKFCFDNRPLVGNYSSFASTAGAVVGRWSQIRLGKAVRAALAADVALKSTTISTPEAILTDLMLAIAASKARRAA